MKFLPLSLIFCNYNKVVSCRLQKMDVAKNQFDAIQIVYARLTEKVKCLIIDEITPLYSLLVYKLKKKIIIIKSISHLLLFLTRFHVIPISSFYILSFLLFQIIYI